MATKPTRNGTLPTISDQELAGSTTRALGAKYKLTHDQIHQMRQRRGVVMSAAAVAQAYADRDAGRLVAQEAVLAAEFEDPPPNRMTWRALHERIAAVRNLKDVEKKYDPRRHKLACALPGDKPVGIVFTGDWQLGSEGVDYGAWEEAIVDRLWAYHEKDPTGLYAVGLGDYQSALSNIRAPGAVHRDVDTAGEQYSTLQVFFHLTKGLWLVLLQGCHDSFTMNSGDIDPVERYCELSGARHGWHGCELAVGLGRQKYIMRLRHRYRFNSSLNPLNAQRRQAEMEGPADVIAHAHLHTSVTGEMAAVGQDTVMLRSGSYQTHDDFARKVVGNVKADDRMPMTILWPESKRVWSCRDFRDGLDYLSMLRTVS